MWRFLIISAAILPTAFSFDTTEFQSKHCHFETNVKTTAYYFPFETFWEKQLEGYVCENFTLTENDLDTMSEMTLDYSSMNKVFLKNCDVAYFNEILVSKFPQVRYIFFENCTISLKNPGNSTENLWALGFHKCKINDNFESSALQGFVNLSYIFVQNSTFQYPHIDEYFLPKKHDMIDLLMDNTNVRSFHKGFLSSATHSLERISCTSCELEEIDSLLNHGAEKLVSFANNKITKLPSSMNVLADSRRLITLDLSGNRINESVLTYDHFKYLTSLYSLDLSRNIEITRIQDLAFKDTVLHKLNMSNVNLEFLERLGNSNLRNIDFSHNQISEIGTDVFEDLLNLENLNLSYNKIAILEASVFASLENLRELRLNSNLITELTSDVFKYMVNLEVVDLRSNPIAAIDFEDWKVNLPNNKLIIKADSYEFNAANEALLRALSVEESQEANTKSNEEVVSSTVLSEYDDYSQEEILSPPTYEDESQNSNEEFILQRSPPMDSEVVDENCTFLSSDGLFANNTETKEIVDSGGILKNGHSFVYQCPPGHIRLGAEFDICIGGELLSAANKIRPSCSRYCSRDVLKSATFNAICKYKKVVINCNDDVLLPGTTADFQCQIGYVEPDAQINSITCTDTGQWDNLPYPCVLLGGAMATKEYNESPQIQPIADESLETISANCTLLSSNGLFAYNNDTQEIVNEGGILKPRTTYNYQCPLEHVLLGARIDVCVDGKLFSDVNKNPPSCSKYCTKEFFKRVTTQAVCKYKKAVIDCNVDVILPGATANFECQYGYVEIDAQNKSITCLDIGEWDKKPYACAPVCGKIRGPQTGLIVRGYATNITNVPWQAAIYKKNGRGEFEHICGGSILTPKLIVTAAHCLWNREINQGMDKSLFTVAVGKTRRDYYDINDTDFAPQFSNISHYEVGPYYQSDSLRFIDDIAVLVLNETIIFKKYIVPICWDRTTKKKIIASNLNGTIAGWGKDQTGEFSETLKFITLPSISNEDCKERVEFEHKDSVTPDKFCVRSDSKSNSLCEGDSGGGFAVERDNQKYFLEGVVSTGFKPPDQKCYEMSFFSTLTNIYYHVDLINELEEKNRVY